MRNRRTNSIPEMVSSFHRPKVFVFDESTTGLDENTAEKVLSNIEEYAKNTGAGIIYISHEDRVVSRCKHVIKLDNRMKSTDRVSEGYTYEKL